MKKLYTIWTFILIGITGNAQIVNIPDMNFKNALLNHNPVIDTNNDGEIQVSEASSVTDILYVNNKGITDLTGITSFTNILMLYCFDNQITTIDLSGMTNLEQLSCDYNQITTLNLNGLSNLHYLYCSNNKLTSLDVTGLNIYNLICTDNLLQTLIVSGQPNLQVLNCSNNQLTALDLSGLTILESFECSYNQIASLEVNASLNLTGINCANNQLSSFDVSALNNLSSLICSFNQLSSLDVSNKEQLSLLECRNNLLTTLNIAGLPNLSTLYCENNQISTLDFSASTNLHNLLCNDNLLTTLDVSTSGYLQYLYCNNNNLVTLNIKNGANEDFTISGNPTLEYICADEGFETETIQYLIDNTSGFPNCHVNSYCSFVPGGDFYTVQGTTHYDANGNGCDVNDVMYPNLHFSISDGVNAGNLIADATGVYHYEVQDGTHTITPIFENPDYFTVFPSVTNVTFPDAVSPFNQDFCITSNGTHNDLEVTLLPTTSARPGFDANYRIIYKNKGTSGQSGTVSLDYYNPIEDFVVANPNYTSESTAFYNTLNWSFSNLQPFETREIAVTFNLNSPLETPPLNSGNLIEYSARITGTTDETPSDNVSSITQTIVNSFDPNDKTCTEGYNLPLNKLGDYLHYIIRFENTGTADAQNIVVSDVIDTTKFDINTLIPLSGSHSFVTKITSNNKVEFIFRNINLPFDDANNDGFVAFKIKTLPSLTEGQIINNSANIYFDYNAPIVTNTYAVQVFNPLSNADFEFSSVFNLSPVPAKNNLIITTKQNVTISSVNIYNTLGQLVQVNTKPTGTLDVSGLKTGSYFIKIISDKGTASSKFIKE
ncbi:DUF7619 domain-containing protein [Flavobacterium phycosphaerae]|uniref:DUF7619 domain-containing protein n=1 Tax=Flavobacterium phycosphaerae TaxID=2697515 RepID=UPI00138B0F97|nr:T9SS type A sorting domain-containing protein [Flavobacterium phycosphaerae]